LCSEIDSASCSKTTSTGERLAQEHKGLNE
jgi:hypothetical protein